MTALWDTYAILARLAGEAPYRGTHPARGVTHEVILLEALTGLRRLGHTKPWSVLSEVPLRVVSANRDDLVFAAHLKASPKARELSWSYADVLGYAMAQRLGIPFLTGDRGFEGLPGVDWRPVDR